MGEARGEVVHCEQGRSNQRMRTQMGTGSAAFYQPYGTQLLVPAHRSELNQASTGDGHEYEGETHWKNSQWMAGIQDNVLPRIWWEGGMAQLPLSQHCFLSLPLQHSKLQNHALLWHSERSSSKLFLSTSAFLLLEVCTNRALFSF